MWLSGQGQSSESEKSAHSSFRFQDNICKLQAFRENDSKIIIVLPIVKERKHTF